MFKRKLKKVLIFLLLIILILQISPISYATGSSEPDPFGKFIDGIAGILFIGVKIMPAIVGKVLSLIMNGISGENITIYNILFNNVELTNLTDDIYEVFKKFGIDSVMPISKKMKIEV